MLFTSSSHHSLVHHVSHRRGIDRFRYQILAWGCMLFIHVHSSSIQSSTVLQDMLYQVTWFNADESHDSPSCCRPVSKSSISCSLMWVFHTSRGLTPLTSASFPFFIHSVCFASGTSHLTCNGNIILAYQMRPRNIAKMSFCFVCCYLANAKVDV